MQLPTFVDILHFCPNHFEYLSLHYFFDPAGLIVWVQFFSNDSLKFEVLPIGIIVYAVFWRDLRNFSFIIQGAPFPAISLFNDLTSRCSKSIDGLLIYGNLCFQEGDSADGRP